MEKEEVPGIQLIEKMKNSPSYVKERTFILQFILPNSWYELKPKKAKLKRLYKNPIYQALEYQELLDSGKYASASELARALGVSRVRVIQILNLLKLDQEVVDKLSKLGETLYNPLICERRLRGFVNKSPEEQRHLLAQC